MSYCPYTQYFNFIGDAPNVTDAANVSTPVPCYGNPPNQNTLRLCSNYTIKCPNINTQCVYTSTVSEMGFFNTTLNNTVSYTVNQSVVAGCCPSGFSACLGLNYLNAGAFGGCANTTAGESCCGQMICPVGTRCCTKTFNVTAFDNFNGGFSTGNLTVAVGCCPPALECCTQHIRTDGRQSAYQDPFFCGQTFNNVTCQLDKWKDQFWYQNYLTQANGFQPGTQP